MTDRTRQDPEGAPDRTPLSVGEAAHRLGVTPDAVRARLHRGTLFGIKDGGEWRVYLNHAGDDRQDADRTHPVDRQDDRQDATGTRQDANRQTDRQTERLIDAVALVAARDETIVRLDAEVSYLRDQLDHSRRELAAERERFDVLHREALGRIPAALPSGVDAITGPRPGEFAPNFAVIAFMVFTSSIVFAYLYSALTGESRFVSWETLGKAATLAGLVGLPLTLLGLWLGWLALRPRTSGGSPRHERGSWGFW